MADIFKYVVVKEVLKDPMYGKTKKLTGYMDDKDEAIRIAKSKHDKDVYVLEKQYASKENLERDFPLYTHMAWNVYIDDRITKGGKPESEGIE